MKLSLPKILPLAAALAFAAPVPAPAQNALVVASCPATRSTPYPAGTQVLLTVDVNGNLCSSAASSGSSAVTVADGADTTQGAQADTACASDNGTCTEIALLKRANQRLTTAIAALGSPFQAGGAIAALPAGASIIGNVRVDQTTPGTTNGVQINAALPAGANIVGNVRIDQTTPGTTNAVVLAGASFTNITTDTDTNVKGSAGTVVGLVVNTAGVGSTVKIFNDADGTCSSGLIGTFSTTAQASVSINAAATIGICAQTAGGTPADITILWR